MTTATACTSPDPSLCCQPGAWERLQAMGESGFRAYGEPLPFDVIDVAARRGVDPHALDHHVEGVHGWEPHDVGYRDRVGDAAECLLAGGCE